MEFVRPTDKLIHLGFDRQEIDDLKQVLEMLNVKLIDDEYSLFDFGLFIDYICSNKDVRKRFIDSYKKVCPFYESTLPDRMDLKFATIKDKYFLFLFCLLSPSLDSMSLLSFEDMIPKKFYSIFDCYFEMIRKHYDDINACYNVLYKVNNIERSGWINAKIPSMHKESISEHMYSMYLLADLYLPCNLEDGYDKERIKKLIMIHDLGEAVIGDIPHPKKTADDDLKEDFAAKTLFFAVRYHSDDSSLYDLWNEWMAGKTINSRIAHDIDVLQFNYQFMSYAVTYPETFNDDAIRLWMRRRPITELGIKLYQQLILDNDKFKERIDALNGK